MTASAVPAVGSPAPDFTLAATDGQKVSLSALRGQKVLVAFFPLAFTSTCTEELCDMRDEFDAFAAKGVKILPISVDAVPSLAVFKKQEGLKTELLSDFDRAACKAYGTFMPERNFSNRAYFLIDGEGVVRWAHVEENPGKKRTNAELFAEIDKLD